MVLRNATDSLSVETTQQTMLTLLERLTNLMEHPMWMEYATGRLRVVLDNVGGGAQTLGTITTVGTVTTVTTLSTLTSMSQLAGYSAKDTLLNTLDRTLWYQGPRQRII